MLVPKRSVREHNYRIMSNNFDIRDQLVEVVGVFRTLVSDIQSEPWFPVDLCVDYKNGVELCFNETAQLCNITRMLKNIISLSSKEKTKRVLKQTIMSRLQTLRDLLLHEYVTFLHNMNVITLIYRKQLIALGDVGDMNVLHRCRCLQLKSSGIIKSFTGVAVDFDEPVSDYLCSILQDIVEHLSVGYYLVSSLTKRSQLLKDKISESTLNKFGNVNQRLAKKIPTLVFKQP